MTTNSTTIEETIREELRLGQSPEKIVENIDQLNSARESTDLEPATRSEWLRALISELGWSVDVDDHDAVIVWGRGESNVSAIRRASTDWDFISGVADGEAWLAAVSTTDQGAPVDAWCVSLTPWLVSADELDRDPAVAGYTIVATNG